MSKYESPNYEVIKKENNFELRRYEAFSTSAVIEANLSGRSGFGLLFGYISGKNKKQEKMSMTIPVMNEYSNNTMTMEFVIPKKYHTNDIPMPSIPEIEIKHYPEQDIAAFRFSGLVNEKKVAKNIDKLSQWIKEINLEAETYYHLARYNSPITLPFLRKNEILIKIKP
jgi:hypothetical protein